MEYKVLPFAADIMSNEGSEKAAQQLSDLINTNASEGWKYLRMETLVTYVTTPAVEGSSGCFGFGATPGTAAFTDRNETYVVVFSKG